MAQSEVAGAVQYSSGDGVCVRLSVQLHRRHQGEFYVAVHQHHTDIQTEQQQHFDPQSSKQNIFKRYADLWVLYESLASIKEPKG